MGIKEDMPVLARHEGKWRGTYVWVDAEGNFLEKHGAHLDCTFPTDGPFPYYQVNTYDYPDGRREVNNFPATYKDKRIWFDTERITGHAWEVDENTVVLTWVRKDDPSGYFYEMIQLDATGNKRSRVWQWFENGICTRRTLINEERVS
jgi:hypothetical protein